MSSETRRSPRRSVLLLTGLSVATWLFVGCAPSEPPTDGDGSTDSPGEAWFEDGGAAAGLDFVHTSGFDGGYLFPETVTGGACLFDMNGDGWLDLYVVQGASLSGESSGPLPTNKLFQNRGDGSFRDVTDSSGTGHTGYGMGCTYGDFDGDGDADLFVTNYGPDVLYRNEGGGRFVDVSSPAGVADPGWGAGSAFADLDGDGDLDLVVVRYLSWTPDKETVCLSARDVRTHCGPTIYEAPTTDILYRNNGDGTFTDISMAAGLTEAEGNGLGIVCGDFNRDGFLDFYVANDGGANRLWMNRGKSRFEDDGLLGGCALNANGNAEGGMGVAILDVEVDGDLDLFMVHIRTETNTFYLNQGGWFEDVTAERGLAASSLPYTGFGLVMEDLDSDGTRDIYVANGDVVHGVDVRTDDPYAQPNLLFRGIAGGRFELVDEGGGTVPPLIETSRAAVRGDVDNDGDVDIVVVNKDGPVRLLRNTVGDGRSWVMFRLLDDTGSDAQGAEVRISAGGLEQHRILFPSSGYLSAGDPRLHFGLGETEVVDRVEILWPDGSTTELGPLPARRVHVIHHG